MTTNPYKNETGVSLSMAVYLATDDYDHNSDPTEISVTGLLRPTKQVILASRIPPNSEAADVSTLVASRMGTSIHTGIENAWLNNYEQAMLDLGYPQKVVDKIKINPTPDELEDDTIPVYMERRSKKDIGKWTISGKFDFVAEGRIEDFKSTKTYSYTMGTNDKKYIQQGSIYRWLNQDIITSDTMAIQFIFTDYSALQVMINPKYPKTNPLEKRFNLMTIPETERFIKGKLEALDKYWDSEEAEMPSCTDEDLWRREPVWKYYKDSKKMSRSTKNFTNAAEAHARLAKEGKGTVLEVKGEVVACKYCPALKICKQKDAYILNNTLKT